MGYFVEPDVVRVPLDDHGVEGEWLDLKAELTYGESEALDARTLKPVVLEGESRPRLLPDQALMRIEYMLAYIVGWSFTNGGEPPRPVEVSRDSLSALRVPVARAIDLAIGEHIANGEVKKVPTTPEKTTRKR